MAITNRDIIKSIYDVGLCIQAMIKTRYHKNVKLIFTKGKYKSLYLSFYRSPHVFQFYIEDLNGHYMVYLKNEKIVKKDYIKREETISMFYQKMIYFFRIIN